MATRLVTLCSFAVVTALAVVWRLRPNDQPESHGHPDPAAAENAALRDEVARLRRELGQSPTRANEGRVAANTAPIAVSAEREPAPPASADPGATPPSREDELAYLETTFASEPRDGRWNPAGELGAKVTQILPERSALRGVECRTSLCRMETTHANLAEYRHFAEAFTLSNGVAALWSGAVSFDIRPGAREGDPVTVVAYLGRGELPTLARE